MCIDSFPNEHQSRGGLDQSMLGTRQLKRVLEVADRAYAKVVLVGGPEDDL